MEKVWTAAVLFGSCACLVACAGASGGGGGSGGKPGATCKANAKLESGCYNTQVTACGSDGTWFSKQDCADKGQVCKSWALR